MNKSKIYLWRTGNAKPDETPMIVTHFNGKLPPFIQLASFDWSLPCYFKLIDLIVNDCPVYHETATRPAAWEGQA